MKLKHLYSCLTIFTSIFAYEVSANEANTSSAKVMTQGLNHLGLTVSKLEQSTLFFTKTLGWREVGGFPDYPSKFVTDGTLFLTLWQTNSDSSINEFNRKTNVGLHHLALTVASLDDLHELHQRFKKVPDVHIEFGPELNGKGPTIHMMIREPSGNRLEFSYRPVKE